MGYPRRRGIVSGFAWPAAALLALLAACSGGSPQVEGLLLNPGDFPGLAVAAATVQVSETAQGGPSAQVELSGPDFSLTQSVVKFDSQETARSVLAGIKQDQLARNTSPFEQGSFQDVSRVLAEQRGDGESLTLFFVQGRALVRVTISGPNRRALLPDYAEKARAKVGTQ